MLNCEQASTLASQALDRKLSWVESIGAWAHRVICAPCRAYRKQLLIMRRRGRQLGDELTTEVSMDDAAKERIRARLRKFD